MKPIVGCALLLVACGISPALALDGGEHCDRCGCRAACSKTCRLVCEIKRVPKVAYTFQCEDFCVPGPSEHAVIYDCECGKNKHVYTPTCAGVRTRTRLVKLERFEEKPSYRWVVENVCGACGGKPDERGAGAPPKLGMAKREPADVLQASFVSPLSDARAESAANGGASSAAARLKAEVGRLLRPVLPQN